MSCFRRVLVVDDNSDTLQLFSTFLTLQGFKVTAVDNAIDALAHASNGVDAVITDLAMPAMDGAEFIRRMREGRLKPSIPIIAVTGQAIDPETVRRSDIDCCRLMLKPVDMDRLAQMVSALVPGCVHDCDSCPNRIEQIGRSDET